MRKRNLVYLMACVYIGTGVNHFIHPDVYMSIMPPYIPAHALLVQLSGIAEIICGALLIPQATRALGAWLLVALLIAVFPANVQMAINYWHDNSPRLWIAIVRLPLQLLFIWWAWKARKIKNNWPADVAG